MNLYHRHNPARCKSTNPLACENKRKPCPIWVRGKAPDGTYIEKSLKKLTGKTTRDWAKAKEFMVLHQNQLEGGSPSKNGATNI